MNPLPPQLDLFTGATSEHSALVYARLSGVTPAPGLTLRGMLIGPYCELSHTLPATVPFVDVGPGDEPLARALVPDPCCWSPELPALYAAKLELVLNGVVQEKWERHVGIRRFAPRGCDLVFDQKRWVLRGVWVSSTTASDPVEWRDANAALVVDLPPDEFFAYASQQGLLVVAHVRGTGTELLDEVRRLGQFPAAVILVIDGELPAHVRPRRIAPNLTIAQRFEAGQNVAPAAWAEVAFVEVDDPELAAARVRTLMIPVVMCRRLARPVDLQLSRAACDELQRDLAPFGDFAGYVV